MKRALTILALGIAAVGVDYARALDIDYTEGTSYSRRPGNGIWWQAGMPYKYQLAGDSRNFAVNKWSETTFFNNYLQFKFEGNYIEFGKIGGNTTYVSDENYSGSDKDPCRQPCEAPRSAKWSGQSKSLGISVMPSYRYKQNEIGVRIGVMKHITETNVIAQNFHDNFKPDPNPSVGYYNMSHRGFTWYYGGQMKIADKWGGQLKLIYIHAPAIRAGYDGWQRGVKDIHLTYRLEF